MRKSRIYHPAPLHEGDTVVLGEQASQHLLRVLRLTSSAPVTLFNGHGGEYDGVLGAPHGKLATVNVTRFIDCARESPLRITLCQGISRGERMDYTLQKAVELGVAEILPLFTEHCEVRLRDERLDKRVAHWHALIISACEQSGRTAVPTLHRPRELGEWLQGTATNASASSTAKLVLDPQAKLSISDLAPPSDSAVTILIGPEGGLSDSEIRSATEHGFTAIRLGPRILRTETAPVAILAALQSRWGDLA